MKKFLLLFSLLIPLCLTSTIILQSEGTLPIDENIVCDNQQQAIVKIVNKNEVFESNGFLYKNDEKYSYIVTTSDVVENFDNYKILYSARKKELEYNMFL